MELLTNNIIKFNATLLDGDYSILTGSSSINFICKCGSNGNKIFRNICDHGAYCDKCVKNLKINNIQSSRKANLPIEKSFVSHPQFRFFIQNLNPNIDPRRIGIQSAVSLVLKCPDCSHIFIRQAHGLRNCRFCEHQELCQNEDCLSCFENSLASRHFTNIEKYKQFKSLKENGGDYESLVALFSKSCAIYDFVNNTNCCRSIFKSSRLNTSFICYNCKHHFLSQPCRVENLKDCPFCSTSNAKILCSKEKNCDKCFIKSFASHPKSKFWDYSCGKNNGKTPHDVFKSGSYIADFICGECNHNFSSSCNSVNTGFWCPYCVGQSRCNSANCNMCNNRKLSSHPHSKYWDYEKNPKNITPSDISIGNAREKFWFKCPNGKHESFKISASKISIGQSCSSCLRKTESKLGEWLTKNSFEYEKEWKPEWLYNSITNSYSRFDFCILNSKTIFEIDGLQHFENVWKWGDPEKTMEQDIKKMKKSIENGYSGVRLFQPDILIDNFDWNSWLKKAIELIKSSKTELWVFPKNNKYDKHIELCIKNNILHTILD